MLQGFMGNIVAFLDFVSRSMTLGSWNTSEQLRNKSPVSCAQSLLFETDCILKKQEADSGCLSSGNNYPAEWDNCFLSGIIDLKDIMELDMQRDAYLPNQY